MADDAACSTGNPNRPDSPPEPGARRLHLIFGSLTGGLIVAGAAAFSPIGAACLLTPLLLACPAVAMLAAWRIGRHARGSRSPAESVTRAWSILLAALLLVANIGLSLQTLSTARAVSLSQVSLSNLSEIGAAIAEYTQQHGEFPDSYLPLIKEGSLSWKGCMNPWDEMDSRFPETIGLGSYVYTPPPSGSMPTDPALILAHERLPWSFRACGIWPEAGYGVLLGDGTVRWLSVREMSLAIQYDRKLRFERGWPLPP